MNTAAKITVGVVSVAVVAGLTALAVPAVTAIGDTAKGVSTIASTLDSSEPTPAATPEVIEPALSEDVDDHAADSGATAYASGTVTHTSAGGLATYTVAPGDTLTGIGDRFGTNTSRLKDANGDRVLPGTTRIEPGDVLYFP